MLVELSKQHAPLETPINKGVFKESGTFRYFYKIFLAIPLIMCIFAEKINDMLCKLQILRAAFFLPSRGGAGLGLPYVALLLMMMSCTPFGRRGQTVDTDSLSMAAHDGDARAQLLMGLRCDRDSLFAEAAMWYELAARQGLAEAQNNLGVMLKDGLGVERDEAKAAEWFRRAAQQGNVLAESNLGWMFHGGRGVEQNYDSAHYWYRKAAMQGHAAAQNNLGLLFRDGLGLPQDSDSARYWFSMAAEQGLHQARHNLETMN